MEIWLNNNHFKKLFLDQISKVSDNAVVKLENSQLNCITSSSDNSIIFSCNLIVKCEDDCKSILNIGDIKKLSRAFDCVNEEDIKFTINNNNIVYKDKNIQFKYHLLENGIINLPKINIQKLESLNFDGEFVLTDRVLSELIKASTFSSDTNKIYFTSEDNVLKGNLTDRTKFNVDSFETKITEDYKGKKIDNLCLNFEIIRILSTLKVNSLKVSICTELGVVLFVFSNNIINMKFVVSALTK
jgi:hypothetical protein